MSDSHNFETPMMQQYMAIKKQYADCLVLYRLGDFYELFLEDAKIGAKVLDIVLTSRTRGKDGKIPMAGVPYHALDSYLAKLVKAGYKVALCDQMHPSDGKNLVKREVIRVITPGTLLDEKNLQQKSHNYLMALKFANNHLAIALCDLSTGLLEAGQFKQNSTNNCKLGKNLLNFLEQELNHRQVSECLVEENLHHQQRLQKLFKQDSGQTIFLYPHFPNKKHTQKIIKKQFSHKYLQNSSIAKQTLALEAVAALITYLSETQKQSINHLKQIKDLAHSDYMNLDKATVDNLELFKTVNNGKQLGSLINLLDETQTAMGGRLLKEWLAKPLKKIKDINFRLNAVSSLIERPLIKEQILNQLKQIIDIERLTSRLMLNLANPKDLIALKTSLKHILQLKELLAQSKNDLLQESQSKISSNLKQIIDLIEKKIVADPPVDPKQGGVIKFGVNAKLDKYLTSLKTNKQWLIDFEQEEKKRTGINSLKVSFNKVFGFYIEISKANLNKTPKNYQRKQTLVNAERFITDDLKQHEAKILAAEEKSQTLEFQIFQNIITDIKSLSRDIFSAAQAIAQLDCISCFAVLAQKYNYVKPIVSTKFELNIKKGRHPVVEQLLIDKPFIPNDVELNKEQQLLIITGPNMAGKSVLIRQVALIVLMAHIGSYVPAEEANISLVDQIFVRSGARDDIGAGLSTFMVEMLETSYILEHASDKSLIIMDEIGRGTSTYDGISIAQAIAQYLVNQKNKQAKTLFATHYHELQQLAKLYPQKIKNFCMQIADYQHEPVFLHQFSPGEASHSFGLVVAQLANLPTQVTKQAKKILAQLENKSSKNNQQSATKTSNVSKKYKHNQQMIEAIKKLDLDQITPLEALQELAKIQKLIKKNTI